jgi:hypothetical protein
MVRRDWEIKLKEVPESLQKVILEALEAMRSHPRHHLAPYYRQKIYTLLKSFNRGNQLDPSRVPSVENLGDRVRAWLAIWTAERVMPIFEQGPFGVEDVTEETLSLPPMLLEAAKGVMQGKVAPEAVDQNRQIAFQEYSIMLDESKYEPEILPVNAILAGWASECALSEVSGWYTFDWFSENEKKRWLRPPYGAIGHGEYELSSVEPNDEMLVHLGGDTAGVAAVGYACGLLSTECEPERLEEFWTWWLTEALPQAWERAASEQNQVT